MEKRYVVTVEFYIYANSDEEAITKGKEFCKSQDKVNDNKCSLEKLVELPFGSLTNRQINILPEF
jgi:hypothetical protein